MTHVFNDLFNVYDDSNLQNRISNLLGHYIIGSLKSISDYKLNNMIYFITQISFFAVTLICDKLTNTLRPKCLVI